MFIENNASNPLLMFARRHVAGRFGIPRHGDDEEHPLEAREIDLIGERFAYVKQHYPDLIFFRKLNTYLLRGKLPAIGRVFRGLDRAAYSVPALRSYSYKQIVEMGRPKHGGSAADSVGASAATQVRREAA